MGWTTAGCGVVTALALVLAGCGSPVTGTVAGVRTIRLSVDNGPQSTRAGVEAKFAQLVSDKSGGRLKVQIYYGGSLGGQQATAIRSLKAGGAEMAIVGTANFAIMDRRWNMFDLPFLFSGSQALYRYMASPKFAQLVQRTASEDGLQYVFPFFAGWRQLVTARARVKDLKDVAGLKLRATDSAVELAYDSVLGARPATLAWGETYLGLTQGLVDGLMIGYTDLADFKMIDAVRHGLTLNVAPELVMGFMDARFFRSLPADLRQDVLDAGSATGLFAQQVAADAEKRARAQFRKSGVDVIDPSGTVRDTFVARARGVYPKFTAVLSRSDIDTIEKLQK